VPAELGPAKVVRVAALPVQRPVLVIDEDPAILDQVQRALQREGLFVVSCASMAQGASVARHLRPQAIVLGVALVDRGGWTTLAQLRGEVVLRGVPVIVASLLDEQARALGLGASAYLSKPVDRDHLLTALAQIRTA